MNVRSNAAITPLPFTIRFVMATIVIALALTLAPKTTLADLRAGAAVVDVTPTQLPVLVNGGMLSRSATKVKTRVNARAIVLDDGKERLAIVVVDSCMMPRELLDNAKHIAAKRTKIRPDRILISATHTHTAPSAFGALGTDADLNYLPVLRERIAEAIALAESRLQPARVGWGSADASEFTALRRWVRRPDRVDVDPFGNHSVRANMHAAKEPNNVTGPSGPEDPELSILSLQAKSGAPIAVLCNFSMHYFSDQAISADYFGLFSDGIAAYATEQAVTKEPIEADHVVGIMSHGCSGDIWRRDYAQPAYDNPTIDGYTQGLLAIAQKSYDAIEYEPTADLAMAETRLKMNYRTPDAQRLQWAQQIVGKMEGGIPKDREQVYAREQVLLHQAQSTEVVVQALRIGKFGIVTTPNETYALTGLKLKLQSPLNHTMVIELANGADGYIPPPEQHELGGYNTWAARSAGLEVQAEPRIVASGLNLLEQVSKKPRRVYQQTNGPAAASILSQKPILYWRLNEMQRSAAADISGFHNDGVFESGVLFFLPGHESSTDGERFNVDGEQNRCVHTAGGRIRARLDRLGDEYTVMMSFWNGMPNEVRDVTGWLFSRDHAHGTSGSGDHLGIGGTATKPGVIVFQHGDSEVAIGKTVIERWTWNQIALIREGDRIRVFLNGKAEPEIDVRSKHDEADKIASCFIGGRSDNQNNWEGRIDEVAIFDEALGEAPK